MIEPWEIEMKNSDCVMRRYKNNASLVNTSPNTVVVNNACDLWNKHLLHMQPAPHHIRRREIVPPRNTLHMWRCTVHCIVLVITFGQCATLLFHNNQFYN